MTKYVEYALNVLVGIEFLLFLLAVPLAATFMTVYIAFLVAGAFWYGDGEYIKME